MRRYIEAIVYQAVAENMGSEQSARMVAMKAATDNAGKIIQELQLIYNKTRQAAITKELSEIVGGAAAVVSGTAGISIGSHDCRAQWKMTKEPSSNASARSSTWSFRATRCRTSTTRCPRAGRG